MYNNPRIWAITIPVWALLMLAIYHERTSGESPAAQGACDVDEPRKLQVTQPTKPVFEFGDIVLDVANDEQDYAVFIGPSRYDPQRYLVICDRNGHRWLRSPENLELLARRPQLKFKFTPIEPDRH